MTSCFNSLLKSQQHIEEPTRVNLNTASTVDHIATICCRNIVNSGVYQLALSDHYLVYCIRKFSGEVTKDHKVLVYCIRKFSGEVTKDHKVIKTRKMRKFEEGQFLTDVASVCWVSVVTQTDDVGMIIESTWPYAVKTRI